MPTKKKTKKSTKSNKSFIQVYRNHLIVAGVLVFAVVASAFLTQSFAAKGGGKGNISGGSSTSSASVKIVPSSTNISNGTELVLSLYSDSLAESVNAVQAELNYPSDKFEYVRTDFTGTVFEIEAQNIQGAGNVSIARGTTTPVSGQQLIGKVVLKAVSPGRKISINTDGSQLVSSVTNQVLSTSGQKVSITIGR